jgi:hypothetical protein
VSLQETSCIFFFLRRHHRDRIKTKSLENWDQASKYTVWNGGHPSNFLIFLPSTIIFYLGTKRQNSFNKRGQDTYSIKCLFFPSCSVSLSFFSFSFHVCLSLLPSISLLLGMKWLRILNSLFYLFLSLFFFSLLFLSIRMGRMRARIRKTLTIIPDSLRTSDFFFSFFVISHDIVLTILWSDLRKFTALM